VNIPTPNPAHWDCYACIHSNFVKDIDSSKVKFGRLHRTALLAIALAVSATSGFTATTNLSASPGWLSQPLPLNEALRIALLQNANILRSLADLEAAHGIAVQTRAIIIPKLRGAAEYEHNEGVETVKSFDRDPVTQRVTVSSFTEPKDEWSGSIRIHQSIYEGGRLRSAWRAARLTKEQALFEYQTVIADALLEVRTAYYDTLLAQEQITVRAAALKLVEQEMARTKQRMDAGAVPRFNVLRSEVRVANERPKLIRAKNGHRLAKNELTTLLGYSLPPEILEDIPLNLTTKLETETLEVELPRALAQARDRRSELAALRREVSLQSEKVIVAKSGYKPSLGVFAGYGAHNSEFDGFYRDVAGPVAGVSMTWDFFDGGGTQGRIREARAGAEKAEVNLADKTRRIEQEVRTAYSRLIEAREVLQSQKKVVEQAEEAVQLADVRYEAGSGIQLDVIDAEAALTEARTTQIEAVRNYLVARARLERAIGLDIRQELDQQVENKKR